MYHPPVRNGIPGITPLLHPNAGVQNPDKASAGKRNSWMMLAASVLLGLSLAACSAGAAVEPPPTKTPAPTATPRPTSTPASTPSPTPTPEPVWSWYWNSNSLREIVLDDEGMVWGVGTGPLIRWNPDQGTYEEFAKPQGMPSNSPLDLLQGSDGALWVTYRNGQIWRFFQGEWEAFERSESVQANTVVAMAAGPDGMVWFCTSTGIARHDSSGWFSIEADESYPEHFCRAIAVDKDGNPWMLGDFGISTFQDREWRLYDLFKDPGGAPYDMQFRRGGSVHADAQGRLWFRLWDMVLLEANGIWTTFELEPLGAKLSSDGALWLRGVDRDRLSEWLDWIAYGRGGGWVTFEEEDFPGDKVEDIFAAPGGVMWFEVEEGLMRYQDGAWGLFPLADNDIRDVVFAGPQDLWVALSDGLSRYDLDQLAPLHAPVDLISNSINALAVDPTGTLWIGTPQGLQSFDGETWTIYPEVGLYVSDVAVGLEGEVWAIAERGIWRLEEGEWRNFEPGQAPGLPDGNADQIAISADGMLYAGISGIREGGVAVYDGDRWKTLGSKEEGIFRYIDALVASPQVGLLVASHGANKSDLSLMHWDGERWSDLGLQVEVDRLTLSPEGVIWMAVEESGLYYWENDTWRRVDLQGFPEGAVVTDLGFAVDGSLWLTTTNGAGRFDGENWQWFNTVDGLGYHTLTALATGPGNTLWFGGARGGLTRLGPPPAAGD